jgi:hypothetical protein
MYEPLADLAATSRSPRAEPTRAMQEDRGSLRVLVRPVDMELEVTIPTTARRGVGVRLWVLLPEDRLDRPRWSGPARLSSPHRPSMVSDRPSFRAGNSRHGIEVRAAAKQFPIRDGTAPVG